MSSEGIRVITKTDELGIAADGTCYIKSISKEAKGDVCNK